MRSLVVVMVLVVVLVVVVIVKEDSYAILFHFSFCYCYNVVKDCKMTRTTTFVINTCLESDESYYDSRVEVLLPIDDLLDGDEDFLPGIEGPANRIHVRIAIRRQTHSAFSVLNRRILGQISVSITSL